MFPTGRGRLLQAQHRRREQVRKRFARRRGVLSELLEPRLMLTATHWSESALAHEAAATASRLEGDDRDHIAAVRIVLGEGNDFARIEGADSPVSGSGLLCRR